MQNNKTKKPSPKKNPGAKSSIKQKRKKPVIQSSKAHLQWRVPDCAMHYMSALVNPFDSPCGACVPSELFPLPSSKVKTFARFKFNLGTAGVGFVAARPTMSNDLAIATFTTSTSVLASAALLSTATNLGTALCPQNQYASAAFTKTVLSRIVAFGMRVKYIGSLMNRNGVTSAIEDPDHADVTLNYSNDTVNSHPYSNIERVGGDDWDNTVCNSGPVAPNEFDFLNTSQSFGNIYPFAVTIAGTPGDLYECEIYQHYELIGAIVVNKTPSHSDPTATGKILEAVKATSADGPIQPKSGPTVFERFKNAMAESIPTLVGGLAARILPGSSPIVQTMVQGLLGKDGMGPGHYQPIADRPMLLTNGKDPW